MIRSIYAGRRAALATMHGKERAVAPPLAARLDLGVFPVEGLDTDRLGTFSGEIPRPGSIRETAIAKARLGISACGLPIAIASEGSYGPHPVVPFLGAGTEVMVFVDDENNLVVEEIMLEERPVYDHLVVDEAADLSGFLGRVGFPEHALIVRPNQLSDPDGPIFKGVGDTSSLTDALAAARDASADGAAFVQSDMRAHMNPTRMRTIGRLAERLAERLACLCPDCAMPGFGVVAVRKGLPCSACGGPSVLVDHEVLGCAKCDYTERRARSDGLRFADPGECPLCNP